jgi:2-polyprenyl-6-methoxyphenol hydroxylase-like FAD-dependent oxidoreductase
MGGCRVKELVVGVGPAGVATALLLARYGVDVRLVERERTFERVFRGEGIMPLGIDALFEMGLGGVLETVPDRRVDSWDNWIDGEEVCALSLSPSRNSASAPCASSLSRPSLRS